MSFCCKYKVPEEVGKVVYKTGPSSNRGLNGSGSLSKVPGGFGGPSLSREEASVFRLIMYAKQIPPPGSSPDKSLIAVRTSKEFS